MGTNRASVDLDQALNGQNENTSTPTSLQVTSLTKKSIEYNHPLFLSPADISGYKIISFQLIGIKNYTFWNFSITLALLGWNKRVIAIVLLWLMNSILKSLLSGTTFASTAFQVWNDLKRNV